MRLPELAGERVVIVGYGREGRAALERLAPVAGQLVVVDASERARSEVPEGIRAEASLDAVLMRSGTGVAVVSPGVPRVHPWRAQLAAAGWATTSGSDLWFAENGARTIAVTGSKGKSTTSALIAHLLRGLGESVAYGGNIGTPLLALPEAPGYVVEVSSFQASSLTSSPRIAVLTSLFPDHIDWHGDYERYVSDKLTLLAHAPHGVVVNAGDAELLAAVAARYPHLPLRLAPGPLTFHVAHGPGSQRTLLRGEDALFDLAGYAPPGVHNEANLCLAFEALLAWGVDPGRLPGLAEAVASFRPLPHRLETVAVLDGVAFVDDTLSTNPSAAVKALEAFADRPVALIVGGHDRGVDYEPLAARLRRHPIAALVTLPENGPRIAALARGGAAAVHSRETLREAVALAATLVPPGGVVLLSPAAPSYNAYASYEEKAQDFRDAVAVLATGSTGRTDR